MCMEILVSCRRMEEIERAGGRNGIFVKPYIQVSQIYGYC